MRSNASTFILVLSLGLSGAPNPASAQAFTSPLEYTLFPISLEWPSPFAEDAEATTVKGRMRLRGPVASVTTHYLLFEERSLESGPSHFMRIDQRFDAHGNLECSGFNDSRSGDRREQVILNSYTTVNDVPLVSKVTAASCSAMGGEPAPEVASIEDVAEFAYDDLGRILQVRNSHSRLFDGVLFNRTPEGGLLSIEPISAPNDLGTYRFDTQGRGLFVPSMAAPIDTVDARWTGRNQFDWIHDGKPGGARAWMCYDEHGTLIEWEFPAMGPWVRYRQSVRYDEHGNWTWLMVDVTFTSRDGTRVVGMPAWGYVREIEYRSLTN